MDISDPRSSDIPQKPLAITTEENYSTTTSDRDHELTDIKDKDDHKIETTKGDEPIAKHNIDIVIPDVIEDFEDVDNVQLEDVTSGDISTMTPSREDLHSSVEIR